MARITVIYEASGILLSDAHREIQELLTTIKPALGETYGIGDTDTQHQMALVALGEAPDRVTDVSLTFTNFDGLLAYQHRERDPDLDEIYQKVAAAMNGYFTRSRVMALPAAREE